MFHNNTYPIITISPPQYPSGQQALKGSEVATVTVSVSNADTVVYSSPNNELSISHPQATRIGGAYNISVPNYKVLATRNSNNAVSSETTVVWIADVSPSVTWSYPQNLRSAGTHDITMLANQRILDGSFDLDLGSKGTKSTTVNSVTYPLLVDHPDKGVGNITNATTTNLAGIITNHSPQVYWCSGFYPIILTIPPFGKQVTLVPEVQDTSRLIADWSFKEGIQYTSSPAVPQVNKYTLLGSTIKLLDKSSTDASSTATTFTIEET